MLRKICGLFLIFTMMLGLSTSAFAASEAIQENQKDVDKYVQEYKDVKYDIRMNSHSIENFSVSKQFYVGDGLNLINQNDSSLPVNNNGADDQYYIKAFCTELQNLNPTMERDSINEYISSYIDIFNMYRDMYPDLSNKEIGEKAKANMLNKLEYMVDDLEYETKNIADRSAKNPDGYEAIVNYINENLKPNYYATLDTTEENVDVLRKHINSLPDEVKGLALLYIEDMEAGVDFDEINVSKNLERYNLFRSSDEDAASKAVAYAKRHWENYNPNYPDWGVDCANFVSQCLYAGEKTMREIDDKIDNSKNWFSYGNKKDTSKVSSTWRGANMFKWHWTSRSYEYRDFDLSKSGELSKLYNYAQAGYPISFLNSKGSAYHTLIITGFNNDNKDVGVRNHTGRVDSSKTGVRWLSGDNVKVRVYIIYKL